MPTASTTPPTASPAVSRTSPPSTGAGRGRRTAASSTTAPRPIPRASRGASARSTSGGMSRTASGPVTTCPTSCPTRRRPSGLSRAPGAPQGSRATTRSSCRPTARDGCSRRWACSTGRFRRTTSLRSRRSATRSTRNSRTRRARSSHATTTCGARPVTRRVRLLRVERVADRRLLRLVVRRKRPVEHAHRREQPSLAVGLHDERVVAREPRGAPGARLRPEGRRLVGHEVGHVVTGPLAVLDVPPDVLLALAPRLALGIGRGAVVEDAAVRRPRPAPVEGGEGLLTAGLAVGGVVDAVGIHPGVDPATPGRGPVGLHLGVGAQRLALLVAREVTTLDLREHRLSVRIAVLVSGVVPRQVQQGPVAFVG